MLPCLTRLLQSFLYSGYDRNGDVKYLVGRPIDPSQSNIEGVSPDIRDEALRMLCDSFDIPDRQLHCLSTDDELLTIYESLVGPRLSDDLEFERLAMALEELPGAPFGPAELADIKTVGDLIRAVAARRSGHPYFA